SASQYSALFLAYSVALLAALGISWRLVLRRQGPETAWLPRRDIVLRVGIGLGLALLALIVYAVARFGLGGLPQLVAHVYAPSHVSYLVQVLLEDLSIAILFVRFRNVLGLRWTLLLLALLF